MIAKDDMPAPNRYEQIILKIFEKYYQEGVEEVPFMREDIEEAARHLSIDLPKNVGDVIYSFRYRALLPDSIRKTAPEGKTWIIRSLGRSRYAFVLVKDVSIAPHALLTETKILDSTPGIIARYALSDEQALLAKVRYNRLIDIFTGITCYSLQNHVRTTVKGIGQVETDEICVGVDRQGVHYVFPVQAKGGNDRLSIVQIEQDMALCRDKFPNLDCYAIGAQFMEGDLIALFMVDMTEEGPRIIREKHYRLVPPESLSEEDLEQYRRMPSDD